jgi:hypothetical protein
MRILTLTFVAALIAPAPTQLTTDNAAFLTGCWKFEANGRVVEEHWMAPAGGALIGMSRTVAKGKLADFEFLQIRELPDGLTYIAKPSNQPEARFVAAAKSADELVFENPSHDFPQRIRYRRVGDQLRARIEGTMNGKARGIDFPYRRTPCLPD